MRRRRILIGAAAGLVLAALGLSLAWYLAAQALAGGVQRWVEERRAEGYVIRHEAPRIGGFPVALTLSLARPVVEAPGRLWRWEGPTVDGRAWLWDPLRIHVSVPGSHALRVQRDGRMRVFDLGADTAKGTVDLDSGGNLQQLDLRLARWRIVEQGGETFEIGDAKLQAESDAPAAEEPRLQFDLRMVQLTLPQEPRPALGRKLARIAIEGEIRGPLPSGPLKQAMARWRDAGGVLDIARLQLRWGPLDLAGDGTIALDQEMRPLAAAAVTLRGLGETLDRLVEAGFVPPREASLAQAVVVALARPPEGGGPPEVKVPITLQDGYLFLGPVRLVKLPPIDWE